MEILKGFSFDLQRHSTLAAAATVNIQSMIDEIVAGDAAKAKGAALVTTAGGVTYSGAAAAADVNDTIYITPGASAGQYTLSHASTGIGGAAGFLLTLVVPNNVTLTYTGGVRAYDVLDISSASASTMAATAIVANGAVKDSTGTITLDTAAGTTNTVSFASGKFAFTFAGTAAAVTATTGAEYTVTTAACVVNTGAANEASILGKATYETSGNLTAATAGTAATNAYTVAGTGTVTMAAITTGQVVSIDGRAYTFTGANAAGVVFTTATGTTNGATEVSGVAEGVKLGVVAAQATMKIGNDSFTRTTNNGTLDITSSGTGIKDIDTAGIEIFTYGVSGMGTYTFNEKTVEIADDATDGVGVVTSATSITNINDLEAKATLSVKDGSDYLAGVTVQTDTLSAALTSSETDYVKVNGVTYYAGRSVAGVSANAGLTLYTTATTTTGSYLTAGTVYLDGTTGTSVTIGAAAALSANRVVVKSVKGDISVDVSGGGYTIHDLDNGDSFTVTNGTASWSYQVVNGELYASNLTTGAAATKVGGNTLSKGSEGTSSLSLTFATPSAVTTVSTAVMEDNVYTSQGDTIGNTKTIGLTVDSKPVTTFIEGSTNYISSKGVISTDSADAIGSVTYDDNAEVFTYSNLTTKAQEIDVRADGTNKWVLNGGEKADTMYGNGKSTLNGGAGNDTITAAAGDVAFGEAGNDSLVGAAGASISGGDGNDTLEGTAADATLTGGSGSDVFVFSKGAITDYNFTEDVIYVNDTMANLFKTATTKTDAFTSAGVITDGTNSVTLSAADGYAVKFKSNDNKTQVVAWAGENSSILDGSTLTDAAVIIGKTNEAGDSLVGGSKNDSIIAGAGDSVYGGAGSNAITLTGSTAETVFFKGTGKDDVVGFSAGFDEETNDKLVLDGVSSITSSVNGTNLTIKSGSSNMVLNNVATSGVAKVRVGNDKAIFASDTATVKLETLTDANYYYGTKGSTSSSKLDLSAIEDAINLDLTNETVIRNFTSVKGGTGDTTLIGGKANETLVSGGGNTSLYGGAGKDVLQGASKVKDSFFMFNGGGNDTISGYEGYTEATADTADVVIMEDLTSAKLISGGVQLAGKDTDKLFISGANANTEIQYSVGGNAGIAKIGSVGGANSFTYAKEVNYYGGSTGVDTLTFNSSDSDNHEVWLGDSSKGVTYASIDVVNASNASGDLILAGDSAKQTITGGKGSSSLWGGAGNAADSLKGGSGTSTFFYGLAEGNDTISCGTADDVVNLYNVKLSDVKSGEITSSVVSVELNDGSKLTVNTGSRDINFKLASGESYTANHNTKQWDQA